MFLALLSVSVELEIPKRDRYIISEKKQLEQERLEAAEWLERKRKEEEQLKQEIEEEQKLLATLRKLSPLLDLPGDSITSYVRLKQAVRDLDSDRVLRMIRSGLDPNYILTESDVSVKYVLSNYPELKHIITVASRLRSKEQLTADGLKE